MGKIVGGSEMNLDEIKTSLMGYDKESVLEYIRGLLNYMDKEKQAEHQRYLEKIQRLEIEKDNLESQVDIYKDNYDKLNRQLEEMAKAWEKNIRYSSQRDEMLREYQQKEESITEILDRASNDAKIILAQAEEKKESMLADARRECQQLSECEREKVTMYRTELARITRHLLAMYNEDDWELKEQPDAEEGASFYEDELL